MIRFTKTYHHAAAMFALVALVVGISAHDYRSANAATNIDISGTLWDFDPIEYACASNGNLTVRVKVNGAGTYSGTCADDTGAYSVTGVSVNPSDVITIFIDDASVHSVYVTKAATVPGNLSIDLFQGNVVVSHEDSGPITNANLDQYDSGQNANIDFTVTSNNLALLGGVGLSVEVGKAYVPGGTITGATSYLIVGSGSSATIDVAGTSIYGLLCNGGTITINADITLGNGAISNSGGTITTTSGTPTVTFGGSSGTIFGTMTFYNIAFTGTGSYVMSTSGNTVTVNNNVSIGTGMIIDQRSNLVVTGNLTTTGTGSILYTQGTPTTTVNGSTVGGGSSPLTFYNFTKSASGVTTISGTGRVAVVNTLTVSAGTLNVTADRLVLGGTVSTAGGTFNPGAGTTVYAQTAGATIPTGSSYGNLALSDGLVGYWKLDETAGTTAADASGFGHDGTHTASPTISSDVPSTQFANDRSLDFDGSSQFVDLGDPTYLDDQFSNKISVSAWIKPDVNKNAVIIAKSNNAAHGAPYYNYSLFQAGNILSWRVGSAVVNSSGSGTGALIVDGTTWQQVTGTYDGTTMRAYINGIEVATGAQTGNVPTSDRNIRIGGRDTTVMDEYFNGKIDEARIYRRSLSAQEVRALAAGNQPGGSGATFTLGGNLDVNGDLTVASGTLDVDDGQNYSINVTGNFRMFGVMQPRSGTITLDGTSSGKVIETGQQRLNNLTIAGSGGGWTLRDRLWVNGTLGISNGTLDVSSANYRVHAGTMNQSGGTFTPQSGTVILDASTNQTVTVTSPVNNLRIEDSTTTNLGGYWKLDELGGTSAKDSSGNGRTGTLTNAPAYTTSLNSTTGYDNAAALDFDGTDDYVAIGDVINTNDTADLTISGWFNRDTATSDDVILAKRNGNTAADIGYVVWIDAATDKLRFEASDGTDEFELASTSAFTATGWTHFAIVWDQDSTVNSEIYINGVDDNATQTGTIGNVNDLTNAVALRIGAESDAGAPFDGKIDDVRVHTSVLTTTQISNLAAGRYADGSAGTATFTLGGTMTVNGTLSLDSGTLSTSASALTVTNLLTLANGNGTYVGGTQTQTLNGGLTVSGSTLTGGAGTIDVNGNVVLSGGTVTTGSGNWTVSGSYTHSGSTMTFTAGNTLTMDGTGTLTSNAQTLQNLSIVSSGTVTLAAATHTVAGNLVLGGSGTPTVTGSTVTMTGTANTIDGGGKILANLTIDPSSAGTITLQNTDLTVSTALSVAANDTLALNSGRTLTLSGNTGTTLTLNGTINGAGRLTYQNSATTFPTTGTIASILRFDMLNGAMTIPDPTNNYGGTVEVYNNTASSRTASLAAATQIIGGSLLLLADGNGNTALDASANPTVAITGDLDFTGVGAGSEQITSGTAGWTVGGNIDFTGGTFTASAGNVVTMTGTSATLIPAGQTFVNLTIDPSSAGTVTMTTSDATVSSLLTVATNDTFSLASGRTVTLSGNSGTTLTLNGTVSGAGRLIYQNSTTTVTTSGTISSIFRFDTVNGAMTIPQRTFGGQVEVYGASANARTVTLGTGAGQTIVYSGNLYVMAEAASPNHVTLAGATNNPTITIGGTLDFTGVGAANEIITTGTGIWTVTGNIDVTGGTFTATSGNTVVMNGTAVSFTGTSTTLQNFTIDPSTAGTVTIPSGNVIVLAVLTVASGDMASISTGAGLWARGTLTLSGTIDGAGTLYLQTASPIGTSGVISSNVYFDGTTGTSILTTRAFAGATRTVTIASDTNPVTIGDAPGTLSVAGSVEFNDAANSVVFSAEPNDPNITIGGDLSATPGSDLTLVLGAGTWTIGGNFDATWLPAITPGTGTVVMGGTTKTMTMNGKTLNNLTITGTITTDALVLNGNVTIQTSASLTAGTQLTINGNFDNNGTFTHSNGTVTFAATSTGKTIECGGSSFYNLTLNSASGGWTMQTDDCVVANAFSLTNAASFTLAAGRTITVSGTFTNAVGGSATTWTGSVLYLTSNGASAINTKTTGGDTYGTLRIGSAADISAWNSEAASIVTDTGGALLSQDHAAIDGRLQVYGSFNSRANEYWSTATDFDGTALGTIRQADVRFADGASFTVDAGDTLTILGESPTANRTVISRQGSGSYAVAINGTINAKYFDFDYLSTAGLTIGSTATVTDLSYGSFDNSAGGTNATYITVDNPVSTVTLTDVVFDNAADGSDALIVSNIRATGSGVVWTMVTAGGLKRGPAYEVELSGATINWDSPALAVADGTSTDIDLTNQTEELSANWTLSSTTGVDHLNYAIGTTSGGSQIVGFTSVGAALAMTHGSLTLTSGTTYYVTVRAVDATGETLAEATSDGVLVDAAAPLLQNLTIIVASGTATITWTTDEVATTQVQYGTTTAMTTLSPLDSQLVTSHSVTVTGLVTGTTYYLRAISADQAGNTGLSSTANILATTPTTSGRAGAPTLVRPVIEDGANPAITVVGFAHGTQVVRIFLDGTRIVSLRMPGLRSTVVQFSRRISLTNVKSGNHSITAQTVNTDGVTSKVVGPQRFAIIRSNGTTKVILGTVSIYRVVAGDTLWKIAQTFLGDGRKYSQIITANVARFPSIGISPFRILINWLLLIPAN